MFIVYTADGVPYYRTMDEGNAECISYNIGGYYVYEKYDFV